MNAVGFLRHALQQLRLFRPPPGRMKIAESLARAGIHIGAMVRRACVEEGLTALWITHDVDQARQLCDYLYLLINGSVGEHGPPERVFAPGAVDGALLQRFAAGEIEDNS